MSGGAGLSKIAIILGGADTVWRELEMSRALAPDAPVIACNHAARDYDGELAAWISMHPELVPSWKAQRAAAGRPPAASYWTTHHRVSPIPINRVRAMGGSSGLLCVFVGIELGFDRMMLCGVPMCQNGKHYDNTRKWTEARQYWPAWERALPTIRDKVRSWGGHTLHMLGSPNEEWLHGPERKRKSAA